MSTETPFREFITLNALSRETLSFDGQRAKYISGQVVKLFLFKN